MLRKLIAGVVVPLAMLAGPGVPPAAAHSSTYEGKDGKEDKVNDALGGHAEQARELLRIRQATKRFRDINVALAEGYVIPPSAECVTAEMEGLPRQLGAMGVHVIRPDLLGITGVSPRVDGTGTHTDFTRPGVLVYEPQADGSYELVAVENLVFAQAWQAAGNTEPPTFGENQYYYMVDNPLTEIDEAHGFTPHYELHVWLYRYNPAGTFMQFNARVSCPGTR
ncbi:hypothetical protein [Caldimonas tepidiphila]|uniref:hypothetical protein n=1 Tax=Caldimonas tepidiphila TaxID=2315841 RepID=UPI000E5B02FA|nr:hypothetical protein [Caldimonas tepidiphila]